MYLILIKKQKNSTYDYFYMYGYCYANTYLALPSSEPCRQKMDLSFT